MAYELDKVTVFHVYVKNMELPFTIKSRENLKTKFWDAHKCSYPTFEMMDEETNKVYVFVTRFTELIVME